MKKFLLSIFAVMLAVFSVQAEEKSGTIIFKTASSDASQAANKDNFVSGQVANNGGFTLSCAATSYCYTGKSGLKMSSSSKNGTFTLGLGGTYNVKSIKVNALRWKSSEAATISVNSSSAKSLTADAADYVFEVNSEISQIKLDVTKRVYICSVTIIYEVAGEETPTAPGAPVLPEEQTFRGSMEVAITGVADGVTVYYTTDGTEPSESNGEEYTAPFEITATTTVKAVAVNEVGASEVVTKIYTLFVVEETEGYYIKVVSEPTDWSGKYLVVYEEGADAYVFNGEDIVNGYVSATTDGDIIKANSEVDAVAVTVAAMEGGYSVKTAGGYIYGESDANRLYTNSSEPQLNTIELTADGVNIIAGRYLRFNSASNQMRFRYYTSNYGESVQLYKYVESLPLYNELKVTDAGYATLYLGFNARIPSTVEAYTVTAVNSGWVSLTQVTGVIPSQTGIIVKAAAGDYKFFMGETATADVTGNLLEGTLYNREFDEEAYVLGQIDGVVGLYLAEMTDGTWLNNANKAYLPVSAVPNASATFYGFDWEGTTGVEEITENREQSTVIYDLTGRRVEAITAPGIYVVNGRKVLVK
ncbi:MAG: hypothetical protein E7088_08345 [Bacteroidales bacterium]|nr:hypothetical protein [Bacteroidales bacterium]